MIVALSAPGQAVAGPLFFEDFEGYTSFSGSQNPGLPLVSEGAKETWYGGRFEAGDGGSIDSDLSVWRLPSVYPQNITFGQFEDDAGLLFRVSTLGVANPVLSFQWKTHNTESGDRFVAGYYVGSINFTGDTPDGPNDNRVRRFNQDGPQWNGGGWVELLRSRNETTWTTSTYNLPGNQANVWVAFWMDNGEGDLGKVDNIIVTPEPMTAMLLLLGLAGLKRRHRRTI
ncbi:MAG: PEP-CTERM sorting domain-containing protein [Phycisphaerae bacterium]|nr:PEP-CTERM sorting domain-containing protein [Phycisphaerae bacterium]